MDSSEVAQYRDSPAEAGSSQSRIVSSTCIASGESGLMLRRPSISGSFLEEKGSSFARARGRKAAPGAVLTKCSLIVLPGRKSFLKKKRETSRSWLSWDSAAAFPYLNFTTTTLASLNRLRNPDGMCTVLPSSDFLSSVSTSLPMTAAAFS